MTTLVIVESPGKIKKLSAILGDRYRIMASYGHVRDLPEKDLGVAPPDFRPTYVSTDKGKGTLAKLKAAVGEADTVLLATDPDREGEAIAWHLADALHLRNPQRITFTEITATAVQASLKAARPIDMDRVHAQEARRVLDRLVGYRVSPALSNRAGQKLTAGRVQSPAVRLVVDREREIRAFKPTEHYGAELRFAGDAGEWTATWQTKPHLAPDQEYLLDDALAVRAAAVRNVTVQTFEDSESSKAPKASFITSTLQSEGGRRLKLKPKRIMELAQRLYEQGVISYHRTDSPNLSVDSMDDIAAYAQASGLPLASKRRTWKAKDDAQEGHEAIRPAHVADLECGENDEERALYKLIWQRAVASQLAEARYAVRTATLTAVAGDLPVTFQARGRTLTSPGWMAIYAEVIDDNDSEEAEGSSNPVPALVVGEARTAIEGKVLTKTTKAPSRFNQNSLVEELERLGIGRPSTYAAIMDNITARGYVIEGAKDFLSPTPSGEAIRDALVGTFQFADLDYTRSLEEQLDLIANRRAVYGGVVSSAWQQLDNELQRLGTSTVKVVDPNAITCPSCKEGQLRRVKGSNGFFWSCTRYREGCKFTAEDNRGKPALGGGTAPPACPTCKQGFLRRITGANGPFWGCSRYREDCKATFPDKRGKPDFTATKKH